ncbi:MAG: hypothetical protein DWQ37_09075 [Planctomycetota bacterium]|nr:MAG: hypothetical protein DWQ37_09075 [Planctomycetota bacterium]
MSEATPSASESSFPPSGGLPTHKLVLRAVLYCSLAVAVVAVAYVAYRAVEEQAAMRQGQDRLVAQHGLVQLSEKGLAPEYSDRDGDLMADVPDDEQRLDPETLVLAYYEGDDDDEERVHWDGLRNHLKQATGRDVVGQPYLNTADQVAAIKKGEIHLVALHAADTPYIVNHAGLVPFAVLGSDSGASGNHLDIAVPADSTIKTLADVRGHKLTCTRPDSITGYRAAIAVLSQEAGLRPGADYGIHFSLGQKRSIRGVVEGKFEVAAISDDKLQDMLADGDLKEGDVRLIYESQVIPRRTIGHVHNLVPELAETIREAVLSFDNELGKPQKGESDEASVAAMRFVPIDYKDDFAFARRINDSFDPRFGQVVSSNPTP